MRRRARGEQGTIAILADLAARASFLAQVHRASGLEAWLTKVIRERFLGLFHKSKKENEQAKECLEAAIEILEKSGSSPNLEQAREALASLG